MELVPVQTAMLSIQTESAKLRVSPINLSSKVPARAVLLIQSLIQLSTDALALQDSIWITMESANN
jgi:hypothetical protein